MNDILFWSGGKDSYLALEFFGQKYSTENLSLLTTFNHKNKKIPHQELPISTIEQQARTIDLDLHKVPIPPDCPNKEYLERVSKKLIELEPVRYLIFGDWHLQDIRQWREEVFGEMGYKCLFPIWKKSLDELLSILLLKPVKIKISAVDEQYEQFIRVRENYNQRFVQQLPKQIDPMGENGEFHTEVIFKEWPEPKKQPLF